MQQTPRIEALGKRPLIAEAIERAGGARQLHDSLTPDQRLALRYCWQAHARPLERLPNGEYIGQLPPPGDWITWLVNAGRGFGKTRIGAEWVRSIAKANPGCRIAIVGATADETRKVMYRGDSGIERCCPPWEQPHFNVTDQCLEWRNGSVAYLYSADKPDLFRGPQHHFAWADEMAKWRRLQDAWDNLTMGLRLGPLPRMLVTTTPRPLALLRELRKRPSTVVTTGSMFDNVANLPASFIADMKARYSGTALGEQELYGEMFEQAPGALWSLAWIDKPRVRRPAAAPLTWTPVKMRRLVVGVDPAETSKDESDETGIVVAGLGEDGRGYILEDASDKLSPDQWARKVIAVYRKWQADLIVAETTKGGELVTSVLRLVDSNVPILEKGGNRGKVVRAEPVAALYEQGKISHVGLFSELERQMCCYVLGDKESPDHMDAAVHALAELMLREQAAVLV
jgi:predicted phage terminase large subunit-like protein